MSETIDLFCLVRMIIHLPVFLYWDIQSQCPQIQRTSIRTMSSNCISSPTSTISDLRVNTHLKGTVSGSITNKTISLEKDILRRQIGSAYPRQVECRFLRRLWGIIYIKYTSEMTKYLTKAA